MSKDLALQDKIDSMLIGYGGQEDRERINKAIQELREGIDKLAVEGYGSDPSYHQALKDVLELIGKLKHSEAAPLKNGRVVLQTEMDKLFALADKIGPFGYVPKWRVDEKIQTLRDQLQALPKVNYPNPNVAMIRLKDAMSLVGYKP